MHDRVGGDVGARAGPVFDDELLAELLGKPLADQPCGDVRRSARWKTDDDMDRTRGIVARLRAANIDRSRASAGNEKEGLSARKHRFAARRLYQLACAV